MPSLNTIIDNCVNALTGVTPQTLTPFQMDSSLSVLKSVNLDEAVSEYWEALPSKPESVHDQAAWEQLMQQRGTELNQRLSLLNTELTRIKNMQGALHIPQLDELIHAAQGVVRPLYDFSARLNN
jgi:hypothetical protein